MHTLYYEVMSALVVLICFCSNQKSALGALGLDTGTGLVKWLKSMEEPELAVLPSLDAHLALFTPALEAPFGAESMICDGRMVQHAVLFLPIKIIDAVTVSI